MTHFCAPEKERATTVPSATRASTMALRNSELLIEPLPEDTVVLKSHLTCAI